jgi:hypothetical protein
MPFLFPLLDLPTGLYDHIFPFGRVHMLAQVSTSVRNFVLDELSIPSSDARPLRLKLVGDVPVNNPRLLHPWIGKTVEMYWDDVGDDEGNFVSPRVWNECLAADILNWRIIGLHAHRTRRAAEWGLVWTAFRRFFENVPDLKRLELTAVNDSCFSNCILQWRGVHAGLEELKLTGDSVVPYIKHSPVFYTELKVLHFDASHVDGLIRTMESDDNDENANLVLAMQEHMDADEIDEHLQLFSLPSVETLIWRVRSCYSDVGDLRAFMQVFCCNVRHVVIQGLITDEHHAVVLLSCVQEFLVQRSRCNLKSIHLEGVDERLVEFVETEFMGGDIEITVSDAPV